MRPLRTHIVLADPNMRAMRGFVFTNDIHFVVCGCSTKLGLDKLETCGFEVAIAGGETTTLNATAAVDFEL